MFATASSLSSTGSPIRQVAAAALAFAMFVACDKPWALQQTTADGLTLKLSVSLRTIPETVEKTSSNTLEASSYCPRRTEALAQDSGNYGPATLQQSVERARLSNPEVARAVAQLRKARAEVDTAGSAYSPQLRLNASSGANGTANGKLASAANAQLSKLLHDFGKTDNLIEEARKREEAKVQEHRDTINRVTLDIVEAWLNAARQSEMARLHQQASTALEEAVRILRLRAEAGLVGSGDVELAQARLAQTRAAGMTACLQREQLLSRLSMLSGGPIDDSILATPASLEANGPTSAWDPSTLPSVRQAEAEYQAAVYHVRSLKAARWPSVYLQATRTSGRPSDSTSNINLTLSMDVLEAGIDSRIDSAGAEVQASRLRVQSVRDAGADTFRRIHAELQSIETRRPLLESQALSTAATRRNFLDQFLAGRRQVLDLLNTHQEVLAADIALASIDFDRMVLVAKLHALHDELPEMMAKHPATSTSVMQAAGSGPSALPVPTAADASTTPNRTP
jgi:adhesin transport system outer membrane protein